LDKNKLKVVINKWRKKKGEKVVKKLDFATEAWMKKNLSGKVVGTPPLGILWKLPSFIDNSLLRQPKLIVNAGDYRFSLKLTKAGFEKTAGELIKGSFAKAKK
jgi:prolyl-tRNA editing enzyme YbaK/EbsC (Cys-tRNA(Pro) deacylase)